MLSADEPRAFAFKRHNAAFFLISALTALIAAQPSAAPSVLALEHVTVIDVATGRLHRDMTVLIEGSRISAVEPAATITMPGAARIVQARGKYLSPGFVETHAHWFAWFRDRPDPVHAAGRGAGVYLANGITTMIDVAGQRNQDQATLTMRAAVAALGVPAPRILVSGRVDAPAVTRSGATDAGELTRRLLALGVDGIKIHRGLTESDLRAVVAETHRASRRVYGHTYEMVDSGYHDYTRHAVEAGVDGVFHVLGLAPVRSDREPRPPAKSAGWQAEWLYGASRWLSVDEASADALIALMVQQGTDYSLRQDFRPSQPCRRRP